MVAEAQATADGQAIVFELELDFSASPVYFFKWTTSDTTLKK